MTQFHIVEYDEFLAQLDDLKDKANFLPDVSSKEGYEKSKRIHLDFRKIENAIEKARKERKAYFLDGGKEVDSQAKSLIKKIGEMRLPHTEAYQELDRLKKEREKKRKDELEKRVADIRELPDMMRDHSSEEILEAMQSLEVEQCEDFFEYTAEALKARNKSKEELAALYSKVKKQEDDAAELERLKKESEERERKERDEAIRREAAEEARKAEIQRQEAEKEKARLDQENREKNKQHIGRIRKEAKESLMKFCDLSEEDAKRVVLAIHGRDIKNIYIQY